MNIRKYLKISFGVATLVATQISCIHDDNWDAPQIVCNNKFDAPTMTMAQVVALSPVTPASTYSGATYTIPAQDATHPAVIFDAYVVSSDENGNFYKTISFQDSPVNPTVGLQIGLDKSMNYADFPVGAHIRIKANGLVIGKYTGVVQLGSVDPNYSIGRIPQSIIGRYIAGVCSGNGLEIVDIVPTEVTLAQLSGSDKYLNTLVKVKGVQFNDSVIGKGLTDKDASGTAIDTDRQLVSASGGSGNADLRTDGYFKTPYVIPNKSGDITFVASKYNATYQNVIRGISDINFTNELPTKLLTEGFDSNDYTTNGWTAYNVAGAQVWGFTTFGNPKPAAYISGLGSVNEDWLVSKSIDLSGGYKSASFSFESAAKYAGNPLEVYVTTDTYNGTSNPNTLNWIKLNPTLDTSNNFTYTSSGNVDLTAYLNKKVRFGFKYTTSSSSAAMAWEIDNIKVVATK